MQNTVQPGRRVTRRGRPPHVGVKSWRRSVPLERLVRSVLRLRRKGDYLAAETNSEIVTRVVRNGQRYLGRSLTEDEATQLRQLARSDAPSDITRVLYRWRLELTDREVRRLQPQHHIAAVMWA